MLPALTITTAWTSSPWRTPTARRTAWMARSAWKSLRGSPPGRCQPFAVLSIQRESRRVVQAKSFAGPLGGPFNVFRIIVPAADDNQVLQPAGDEQLSAADEAEISGSQEWAF